MELITKVHRFVDNNQLLLSGDRVLIGLSGGPDSVALVHLLVGLRTKLKLSLGAVYVNHGIRERAAKREEKFCAQLCERFDIDFHLMHEDIPALAGRLKKSLEEAARDFRLGCFDALARDLAYTKVALGHHADDQAETVLFRICRGSGRSGLLGIAPARGKIIRPLLSIRKREILSYLKSKDQTFCEDRSNRDLTITRNYIRHRLLGEIRERINPQVDQALINLAMLMAPEEEYLERQVSRKFARAVSVTPGGKFELDLDVFVSYAIWVRRRLLRRCLTGICSKGLAPARAAVERLEKLVALGEGSASLPGRIQAVIENGKLVLMTRRSPQVVSEMPTGKAIRLQWPRLKFAARITDGGLQDKKVESNAPKVTLDCSQVHLPLTIRGIRPGDRFRPLGMSGRKKTGNYLTDRKVPRYSRDEILVVCDQEGIIWLVGHEIDHRVRITARTKKVLTIEYSVIKPTGRSEV